MRPDYNIYTKDAQYNSIIQNFYLIHNFNSEDQRLNIQSNIYQDNYELDPNSLFQNTFTGYSKAYKYAFDNSFFIREQISYKMSDKFSVVGGVSFQNVDALAKTGDLPFKFDKDVPASLQNQYYLGTNTTDQNGNDLTIYQDFYYVEQQNYGSFAQVQWSLSMVQMTAGLRYDYNTRYGGATNPRIGVVVKPGEKFKMKFLYGESFLAPSVYKAFQHYGSFYAADVNDAPSSDPSTTVGLFGPFWHLTNPDLKPEKLSTVEFGLSYITSSLGISADGYYNMIDNLIVAEFKSPGDDFQGVNVGGAERPINHGEATTYGFTVKLDSYHELGKLKLQGYLAYSYSDGDIDSNPLPYSAQNTVKAGVMMKYGKFSLNPRVIYRSATTHSTEKDSNGDYQTNDSYMVLNLFARFSFNKTVAMYFKATNLLDKRYYNVSLGQGESFYATPQDPIRLNVGVNVKLGGPK
jgi:iron complex outermembrane receptor protein